MFNFQKVEQNVYPILFLAEASKLCKIFFGSSLLSIGKDHKYGNNIYSTKRSYPNSGSDCISLFSEEHEPILEESYNSRNSIKFIF